LLYLAVDDIEVEYARLRDAGVEVTDAPHMIFRDAEGTFGLAGTEEWMAFFKDSEGNTVGLVERRT
jgi:methylmalonyl-CoA/ethylmalonyl-CoA epimerase